MYFSLDLFSTAGCPLRLDMFVEFKHLLHAPGHPRVGMCTSCGKPPGHFFHTPTASPPPSLVHDSAHPLTGLCMLCGQAPEQHPQKAPLPRERQSASHKADEVKTSVATGKSVQVESPEKEANICSRLTWFWMNDLMEKGAEVKSSASSIVVYKCQYFSVCWLSPIENSCNCLFVCSFVCMYVCMYVCIYICLCVSFGFVLFLFFWFRFVSFLFVWFRFVSFRFVSFRCVWFRFVSSVSFFPLTGSDHCKPRTSTTW
jgi:hypothetical protein